jgi:hypothetical protein
MLLTAEIVNARTGTQWLSRLMSSFTGLERKSPLYLQQESCTNKYSIGSFYAFILHRVDRVRLTVVARSNYDAVVKNVRHPFY